LKLEETIRVTRYISAQLLRDTKILAALADAIDGEDRQVALAGAAVLMGLSAIEAALHEAALLTRPHLYTNAYRRMSVNQKYLRLRGADSKPLKRLVYLRNALAHSEPENERGRDLSKCFNARAAAEITEQVILVCRDIWGTEMPKWYSDVAFPCEPSSGHIP